MTAAIKMTGNTCLRVGTLCGDSMSDSRFVGLYDWTVGLIFRLFAAGPARHWQLDRGIVGNNSLNFNMMAPRPSRLAVLATFGT
jgi:hypothetical protein